MNIREWFFAFKNKIGRYYRGQVESLIQYDAADPKIQCPSSMPQNYWTVTDTRNDRTRRDVTLKITCEGNTRRI